MEAEIDDLVFGLYGLTADERTLVSGEAPSPAPETSIGNQLFNSPDALAL